MRYIIAWAVLAVAMITLCLIVKPTYETLGLCFLAWVGGVASTLAVESYGRTHGKSKGQS